MAAAAAGAVAQQIPSLLSALQLAASVGQINQSKAQHGEAIDKSVGMHQAQMEKSLELHQESIDNNTIYHQEQITLDQQLHQHSVDLEKHGWDRQHVQWGKDRYLARKQAEREEMRDDWDQKNRRLDTAFLSATLIFSMIIAIICEGMPPMQGDDDGDPTMWSSRAEDIGLDSWMFILWAASLALALSCVLLSMVFIWRAMTRMSRFLSELNKVEHQWWKIEYKGTLEDDDYGLPVIDIDDSDSWKINRAASGRTLSMRRTAGDGEYMEQMRMRWEAQFDEADADRNELLEKKELKTLLDADGFEFHDRTLGSIFDHFASCSDDGKVKGLTKDAWLRCRRRIMIRSTDTSYPERMRMYWKRKVRAVYSASVVTVALSLVFTLGCLCITVYSRLTLLADNETAGNVFVFTVFGVIVVAVGGFEVYLYQCDKAPAFQEQLTKNSEVGGEPDKALLADPMLPADAQRRWDEYEFTRQFIRGKLWQDTEGVVKELEKAIESERAIHEDAMAGTAMNSPSGNGAEAVRIRSIGRPSEIPAGTAPSSPLKRRFSNVLITPTVSVRREHVTDTEVTNHIDAMILGVHASPDDVDFSGVFGLIKQFDLHLQRRAVATLQAIGRSNLAPTGQVIVTDPPRQLGNRKIKWIVLAVLSAPGRPLDEVKLMNTIQKALEEVNKLGRSLNHGRNHNTMTVAMDVISPQILEHVPDALNVVYKTCREYRGRIKHIMLVSDKDPIRDGFVAAQDLYEVDQEAWRLHFKKAREREQARMRERILSTTGSDVGGAVSNVGGIHDDAESSGNEARPASSLEVLSAAIRKRAVTFSREHDPPAEEQNPPTEEPDPTSGDDEDYHDTVEWSDVNASTVNDSPAPVSASLAPKPNGARVATSLPVTPTSESRRSRKSTLRQHPTSAQRPVSTPAFTSHA